MAVRKRCISRFAESVVRHLCDEQTPRRVNSERSRKRGGANSAHFEMVPIKSENRLQAVCRTRQFRERENNFYDYHKLKPMNRADFGENGGRLGTKQIRRSTLRVDFNRINFGAERIKLINS